MPSAVDGEPGAELVVAPEYQAACEPFVVVGQDVELDVSFCEMGVSGTSTLLIFPLVDGLEEVSIDARQCEIDLKEVRVDGARTKAWYNDPYDLMDIPSQWELGASQHHVMKKRMAPLCPEKRQDVPISQREKLMEHALGCVPNERSLRISLRPQDLQKDEPKRPLKIKPQSKEIEDERNGIKISIPFRSKRVRDGLHFVGTEDGDTRYPHVYTRHSDEPGTASCIFPCIDDPGQRHLFKVSIKCPRTLGDALEQPLATQQASGSNLNGNRKRKHGEESPQQQQQQQPQQPQQPPQQPRSSLIEEDKLLEMTVICSGNLTGEQVDPDDSRKKIMSFECQNAAARHIGFVIGPFEHIPLWAEFRTEESDERLGANAAKVHGYCLPRRADEVRNTCAPIVAAVDYFALEFGRYPFDGYKLCFVEDMVSDTAEATSLSLCSSRMLYPSDIIDPEIDVTRRLVHSLASQYLGVHIVPNKRSDRWLVVAIQWYMTDLFLKTLCGTNWYKFHLKTLSDRLVEADVGRPSLHDLGEHLRVGTFESDFMALKAPLVLFILDQRMSKYPGSIGVSRVVSQMVSAANISNTEAKTTSLCADDFRRSCEKKSQYRPEAFWNQWVYGSGCPKMVIKQKFNKKNLNVDITATQIQASSAAQQRPLETDDFWREFQEDIHHVYAGEIQKQFTGPFTIRIHEADGTPYEHYLDIREDDKNGTTWSIPYNTKYKRLKRKGRQRDPAAAAAANPDGRAEVQEDDVVYFNMLGDVLLGDEDMDNWGLKDWEADVQHAMDQESYEWIRFDCNFEWLCDIATDMPGYMYLAQLQQDRDVVAHQDAMLFWSRGLRHPVASSIETRTVYDRRYYHGIRTMAVDDLPKQAVAEQNYIGMAHLILTFRHFFCYRVASQSGNEAWQPAPNDFSDKAQYAVQSAMPGAIGKIRGDKGRCPKSARAFLLDLLLFNDNSSNDYSDQFYIAELLNALTTSLINEDYDEDRELIFTLNQYDEDDVEFKQFIEKTIEELDRYRRMDEWTCSFQNIWTTTALECKMRLMRARVIPAAPLEFLQYLQDDNLDLVRIKAFECLVELDMLAKPPILKLMLSILSTDRSPFVRDRLFKAFCRGVAAIAFGDSKVTEKPAAPDLSMEDEGGLIVEQGEAVTAARQAKQARRQDISAALVGLREEVKGHPDLQAGLWKTFESMALGLQEKRQVLELCQAMFEPEDAILVTLPYPRVWKATRAPKVNGVPEKSSKKRCIINFTSHYRTTPRNPLPVSVPQAQPAEPKPSEPKKIKLQSKMSFSGPSTSNGAPAPPSRQPSISVTVPKPSTDSISVRPTPKAPTPVPTPVRAPSQPPTRTPSISAGSPPPPLPTVAQVQQPNGTKAAEKRPKTAKKRMSEEVGAAVERPKKIAKTDAGARSRRKIVNLKFTLWDQLREDTRRNIEAGPAARSRTPAATTIVATPLAKQKRGSSSSFQAPRASNSPAPPAAESNNNHATSTPRPSSKPRKPLPSSAPAQAQATPTPTESPAQSAPPAAPAAHVPVKDAPIGASPAPSTKPKTVIKLRLPSLKGDPGQ